MQERLRSMFSRFLAAGRGALEAKWAKATALILMCLLLFCTGLYLGLRSALKVRVFPPASSSNIPATNRPDTTPSVQETPENGDATGGRFHATPTTSGAEAGATAQTGTGETGTRESGASSGERSSGSEDSENVPGNRGATGATVRPRTPAETLKDLSLPVEGQIYRTEGFYFNEAFSEWRYHNGVDFRAPAGQSVRAALAGTVKDTYENIRLGTVIILSHEGDVETLYGCITRHEDIIPGKEVAKGDVIGWVSDTGPREGDSIPHLHFEVHSQGKYEPSGSYLGTR